MYAQWESQKEKKEKEAEIILGEIVVQKCPNLMKTVNMHIQESQQTQVELNSKRSCPMHIVLKVPKRQKENPESSKRKVIHYIQGFSTRLRADF